MGLDIVTSDYEKDFHIGYIGFSNMRAFFILHYDEESYYNYCNVLRGLLRPTPESEALYQKIFEKIDNLSILIDHSDCDGELTSDECKKLLPCLFVDEDKINGVSSVENNEYYNRIIGKMYEFIELVNYCASNDKIKLLFG